MENLKARISAALENELAKIYDEMGITSGDISPEMLQEWEQITEKSAVLFWRLIVLNK